MTKDEVKELFKRIKSNYSSFIIDEYKMNEWLKELKNYSSVDVHKKLEEHMKSIEYGQSEPKLYYLTKYLVKEADKNKKEVLLIKCSLCDEYVDEKKYNRHYERCLSVDFIVRKRKQLFNQDTSICDVKKYRSLDDEIFDRKYIDFIGKIYNYVDNDERIRLDRYIVMRGKHENN